MQHVCFTLRSCFLIVCLLVFLQLLLFCSNFFNLEQRTWSTNDKKTKKNKQTKFMITLHIFVNTKYYISQYFKCVQLNQRGKPALGETQRVHFRKKCLALFCQQRAAVSKVEHDCNSRPSFTFTTQMHLSVHFAPTFRTTYNCRIFQPSLSCCHVC